MKIELSQSEPAAVTDAPLQEALSSTDLTALMECEAIIRNGNETIVGIFVRQGRALRRICNSKLYRAKYKTFEEYCPAEFEFSDRHARGLMRAADIFEVLQGKNFLLLPASESQARPLSKLPREEWAPAWQEVVETAQGKIRANHVAAVVQRRLERIEGGRTIIHNQDGAEALVLSEASPLSSPVPAAPEPKPVIDVHDLSTRERRFISLAVDAKNKLMELADAIGTADGKASANVFQSIYGLDALQEHLLRKIGLLDSRKKEGVRL